MNVNLRFLVLMLISSSLYFDGWAQGVPSVAPSATAFPSSGGERKAHLLQRYRFYAGSHAAAQVFRVVSPNYPIQEAVLRPVYGFVGYQLSPHLAIQTGFLQYHTPRSGYYEAGVNSSGQYVTNEGHTEQFDVALPFLLRYRIARIPTHRLHLDALLGLTIEFNHYQSEYTLIIGSKTQSHSYINSRARNMYLTGGLGAGFDITPHIELMAEASANRNTTSLNSAYAKQIMFGIGVGLRYRFNVGKRTK